MGIAVNFPCCQNELLPVARKEEMRCSLEDTVVRSRARAARASHWGCVNINWPLPRDSDECAGC